MKKLLIMLSMVTIGATNLNVLNLVTGFNKIKVEKQIENSIFKPLDWKAIKVNIDQMYSNFLLSKVYSEDEKEVLEKAKAKTLEYFNRFENKDSSYEELVNEIKNEHKDFKKEYEENWDNSIGIWVSTVEEDEWEGGPKGSWLGDWMGGYKGQWLGSSGTSWSQPPIRKWIEPPLENLPKEFQNGKPFSLATTEKDKRILLQKIYDIDILGRTCSSVSVATGLVAAGFWALAWAGGISIPWAVAASTVSATLGILAAMITLATSITADEIQEIETNGLKEMKRAGTIMLTYFRSCLLAGTITSATIVTATSWVVPFVLGVLGLIIEVGSWIYWVNPNIIDI